MPSIKDAIFGAFQDGFRWFMNFIVGGLKDFATSSYEGMLETMIGTPSPENGLNPFAPPGGGGVWDNLFAYYSDVIVPLALIMLMAAYVLGLSIAAFSSFLSSYDIARLNRRIILAALGILGWFAFYSSALNISNELARFIAPDITSLGIGSGLAAIGSGVVIGVLVWFASVFVIASVILLYTLRTVVIYVYAIAMPILFVFWALDVGYFKPLSSFAEKLMKFVTPVIFFTLPSAFLLRTGKILADSSFSGFILAIAIPLGALVAPRYLFNLPGQQGIRRAKQTAQRTAAEYRREQAEEEEGGGGGGGYRQAPDTTDPSDSTVNDPETMSDQSERRRQESERTRSVSRRPPDFSVKRAKRRYRSAKKGASMVRNAPGIKQAGDAVAETADTIGSTVGSVAGSAGGGGVMDGPPGPDKSQFDFRFDDIDGKYKNTFTDANGRTQEFVDPRQGFTDQELGIDEDLPEEERREMRKAGVMDSVQHQYYDDISREDLEQMDYEDYDFAWARNEQEADRLSKKQAQENPDTPLAVNVDVKKRRAWEDAVMAGMDSEMEGRTELDVDVPVYADDEDSAGA